MVKTSKIASKHRVALAIQYVGSRFHGWQLQPEQRTVQGEIKQALETILDSPVVVHAAGRTDAGVHASGQVAHFDSQGVIPSNRWASVLNSRLPEDILILASASVESSWHAQFSAQWRRYRYLLYTDPRPNLFVRPFSWHYYYEPLDEAKIQAALSPLLGCHDLEAFRRTGSARPHSVVEVQAVECHRQGAFLQIEIQASGFLYGMVRLLVGLLVQVGRGKLSPESFTDLWRERRRDEVKYAAPARGLCLLRVGYSPSPFPEEVWRDTLPQFSLPSAESFVYCAS